VLSLKRSTAGAFVVPFRVLRRKNTTKDKMCYVRIGTNLRGEKKFQAKPTKLSKIPTSYPSFLKGRPPPPPPPPLRINCLKNASSLLNLLNGPKREEFPQLETS